MSRFFELIDGATLAVTGDSGVPLIRYHIADRGGLMEHGEMLAFVKDCGLASLDAYGLMGEGCPLPFVWVFGRADFTVSFYGANVYPENVAVGLEQPGVADWLTGKFVMEVRCDEFGSQSLRVAVELLPSVAADPDMRAAIAFSIQSQLFRLNSEFANYVPAARQIPDVALLPFGDPEYFPAGVKHRYTR
jgi:phenylacetate-CoA ligase